MLFLILIILFVFILALAGAWFWYVSLETPKEPDAFDFANEAFKNKDFKQAESILLKLLAAKPASKEGRYLLGQVYQELKQYEKAKECFDKLLKTSPKDAEVLFSMAKTLEEQQSFDEAKEFYQKASAEDPKNIDGEYNIGVVSFKQGNYADAQKIFEKAVEKNPEDSVAKFFAAKCQDELCDYSDPQQSQAVIERYLQMSGTGNLPKEFDVSLAIAYAKTGQLDKTLAACQRALECDAENVETYKVMGLTQLIMRDLNGAKNTLTTGLHLDSSDAELHELLSYVLCQQKKRCAVQHCRDKYKETVKKFLNKNNVNEV